MFELFVLMMGGFFLLPVLAVAGAISVAFWAGWIAIKTVWFLLWGFVFAVLITFVVIPLAVGGVFVGLLSAIF